MSLTEISNKIVNKREICFQSIKMLTSVLIHYLTSLTMSALVEHIRKNVFISCCCRYPSLQVWAVWESLHTALLSGVPYEKDSWCTSAVCLPPETLQDLCVWRLRLYIKPPWWVLPPCETVPPWQPCPPQVLPPSGSREQQLSIRRP